jgi:hypothetical protein
MTVFAAQCLPQPRSIKSSEPVFFLHINQPVDPEFTAISYLVKGEKAGAGYGRWETSGLSLKMTAEQDIPIGLTLPQNEQRATALKAVVFCRGYRLAFVNVPSLARVPSKRTVVDLVPLDSVALAGRVDLPEGENPDDLRLEVHYDITLLAMSYFEQMEGISGGGMKVAATMLAANGSFTATVPDFANDPALKGYGRLHFGIRSMTQRQGVSKRPEIRPRDGIPVASSYPDPIALELRWVK